MRLNIAICSVRSADWLNATGCSCTRLGSCHMGVFKGTPLRFWQGAACQAAAGRPSNHGIALPSTLSAAGTYLLRLCHVCHVEQMDLCGSWTSLQPRQAVLRISLHIGLGHRRGHCQIVSTISAARVKRRTRGPRRGSMADSPPPCPPPGELIGQCTVCDPA